MEEDEKRRKVKRKKGEALNAPPFAQKLGEGVLF